MRGLAPALLLVLTAASPLGDERSFMVSGFERVRVDGPYDVRVVTGSPFSARAVGGPDALRRLALRVDGGTLVVATGNDNQGGQRGPSGAPTVVTVTVPVALRAALINGGGRLSVDRMKGQRVDLGVNGAGALKVEGIDAGELAGTLTGTGAMTLGGIAGRASFGSYGAGSIDATGLVARDLTVRASSSGNGSFAARYTARINAVGVGTVTVAGQPKCTVTGTGPVSCGDNIERN